MTRVGPLALLIPTAFLAEGVMCPGRAGEKRGKGARVLTLVITTLLTPPILILAGFMALCYKRRQTYAVTETAAPVPVERELAEAFSGEPRLSLQLPTIRA